MILNRIATAIREQNWFTVLLEIAIVVIGIYLGLEATNWNQAREDRKAEIAYLERIRSDIELSLLETRTTTEFQTRHASYGGIVLEALDACELDDSQRDLFASGIYLIGKHAPAPFVRASIQELLSSGRLTIIRNAALRQALVEMLQDHENHLFYMSDVQLRLVPHVNYIDSVAPIVVEGPIGGGAMVTWDQLDADLEVLCKDRRFSAAVKSALNYTWDSTGALLDWAENLEALMVAIDAELATRKQARR